ncbi:MAG: nitroreductase [Caldilineaceae bacterium]|nr:nitroreductase [Caldilineaceae bacterium]
MNETIVNESTANELATNTVFNAVADTIRQRRTIKQFLPQPVPRPLLQELLELAIFAPNHRLTEPWRFYVLDGASRDQLGTIAAQITVEKIMASGVDTALAARKGEEAATTWRTVPTLLYVTMLRDANPEIDLENYGAVCCALQNFALAAHAAGIGTSWSSGAVAAAPALHALVGAGDNERMVGLIRVGYLDPAISPPKARRKSGATHTTWVDAA